MAQRREIKNDNGMNFLNISKEECLSLYKDILANSDRTWSSAKILSEQSDYGSAVSMAIISVEEMVKAFVLCMDGHGFRFRSVKGVDSLFSNHQIRYVVAYGMFVVSIFGEEIKNLLIRYAAEPQELIYLRHKMINQEDFLERNLRYYTLRKMVQLKKELKWFSKVDIFRQEGFYSDYDDKLKTPLNIEKKDYMEVISRLEKVRQVGKVVMDTFESNEQEYMEVFASIQKDFNDKRMYNKMAVTLKTIDKRNPFASMFKK